MALTPAPEGSPASRFATLLRHHMQVGTRPAGKRGTGPWSPDAIAAEVGLSRRTLENYRNGSTLPPDASNLADAFFGEDPRHTLKRRAFFVAFAEATGTEPPPGASAISNIPVRVPTHFIGRDDALTLIHTALQHLEGRVTITALHGLRGVGKTVLAARYAEWQRTAYRVTWWIHAQTESTLKTDLVGLGIRLDWVVEDEKQEPALAAVMGRLRDEGDGILLIYDNAIDSRSLAPYLPRGGASRVIITSNSHAWRSIAEPVEISVWPKNTGADYLIARTGRANERDGAESLSETLGGLALAHEQAAAYCERLDVSFADYQQRFIATPVRMLDDERHVPVDYRYTVARTFALAIDEATKIHPAAETLITYAALLAPEPIPLFLFVDGCKELPNLLAQAVANEDIDEVIAALRTFALVDLDITSDELDGESSTKTIRLHRLVREIAAARPVAVFREEACQRLLRAIVAAYPGNVFDVGSWPLARRLDALALAILKNDSMPYKGSEEWVGYLLNALAVYRLVAFQDFADARRLLERALDIRTDVLGPDHDDTVLTLTNLAGALLALHEDKAAQELFESALKTRMERHGPKHPMTLQILHNLAMVAASQGDLEQSRVWLEETVKNYIDAVGLWDGETADTLYNLAAVMSAQGDATAAMPLFQRALAIYGKTLGSQTPAYADCLVTYGVTLGHEGRLHDAKAALERALEIRTKLYGPEHELVVDISEEMAKL